MRHLIVIALATVLAGCFGDKALDTSTTRKQAETVAAIKENLAPEQVGIFEHAMMYHQYGGSEGRNHLVAHLVDEEIDEDANPQPASTLSSLDGMTGTEIVRMHKPIKASIDAEVAEYRELAQRWDEIWAVFEAGDIEKAKSQAKALHETLEFEGNIAGAKTLLNNLLYMERVRISKQYEEAIKAALDNDEIPKAYVLAQKAAETVDGSHAMAFTEKFIYGKAVEEYQAYKAFTDYLPNIDITEITAKRIDSYKADNVPAIRVSVKNTGDRTVTYLAVTAYFNDRQGNPVHERTFPLVSDRSLLADPWEAPLKPNYSSEMPEGRYLIVDSVPGEWEEGNVEIEITDIELKAKISE